MKTTSCDKSSWFTPNDNAEYKTRKPHSHPNNSYHHNKDRLNESRQSNKNRTNDLSQHVRYNRHPKPEPEPIVPKDEIIVPICTDTSECTINPDSLWNDKITIQKESVSSAPIIITSNPAYWNGPYWIGPVFMCKVANNSDIMLPTGSVTPGQIIYSRDNINWVYSKDDMYTDQEKDNIQKYETYQSLQHVSKITHNEYLDAVQKSDEYYDHTGRLDDFAIVQEEQRQYDDYYNLQFEMDLKLENENEEDDVDDYDE